MSNNQPLVSIGIPTYNRAFLLRRSIESALNQDYKNIEVIVSDNASTDETEYICKFYSDNDNRFKYIRQTKNIGASANFSTVLGLASGDLFMWLGDDDWIDRSYVTLCAGQLISDSSFSLISGAPQYYRNGAAAYDGKQFDLLSDSWMIRVVMYYFEVTDNGMYYGVMRTSQINKVKIPNAMGGDWHLIANIASLGKIKVIPEVSVHRELGGATTSYKHIANSLGLPKIQGIFPMTSIALSAFADILFNGGAYRFRPFPARVALAFVVFQLLMLRHVINYTLSANRFIKRNLKKIGLVCP